MDEAKERYVCRLMFKQWNRYDMFLSGGKKTKKTSRISKSSAPKFKAEESTAATVEKKKDKLIEKSKSKENFREDKEEDETEELDESDVDTNDNDKSSEDDTHKSNDDDNDDQVRPYEF